MGNFKIVGGCLGYSVQDEHVYQPHYSLAVVKPIPEKGKFKGARGKTTQKPVVMHKKEPIKVEKYEIKKVEVKLSPKFEKNLPKKTEVKQEVKEKSTVSGAKGTTKPAGLRKR